MENDFKINKFNIINIMSIEFCECIGEFYFHEENIRLDLWDEFLECGNQNNERVWLVESGDRVLFNQSIFNTSDITLETIEKFCKWLNEEIVEKKWKEKKLSVWGKIIFFDDLNHDIVAIVLWKDGKFQIKIHNFSL